MKNSRWRVRTTVDCHTTSSRIRVWSWRNPRTTERVDNQLALIGDSPAVESEVLRSVLSLRERVDALAVLATAAWDRRSGGGGPRVP